ncbi:PTS cellobiose transporter subunit IIC [Olsenella sp. An285]|uniref:PTS sugar transporter subunit IIC n=1 Tax=Olsenella sp. An285 TaxID=1965621 RepID=UPI000B36BA23|nr:PTS transporter subunit EIIC [Olsenella sp. An285]OUO47505.1 PTS cellobiose transporter subunit IIC [Olsenella sp. An285]
MANGQSFLDKFSEVSARIGNQVHLRSLRDGFATIMPVFILAGLAALFNNVLFTFLWSVNPASPGIFPNADILATAQYWGAALSQGALSISAILLCGMVGYSLATNKRFDNPISCVVVSLAVFFIMMPQTVTANLAATSPLVTDEVTSAAVTGAFITNYTGTNGMFTAIIIGLLAPTLFIKVSGVEKLRIKMPEGVPPAVEKSFNVLIPMLLTLGAFGVLSMVLYAGFQTDVTALINTFIQTPLRALTTNPIGLVVIYSLGVFLFTLGIHQSTINGVLVEPVLTIVLTEAMELYATGGIDAVIARPDLYLNMNVINVYALMGGSGCTLALLIATFICGKWKPSKEIAKLGLLPGIFNINEPVIYGYPIVFNIPLMVPFVLNTIIGILVGYFATVIGLVSPTCIQVPWTTPIIASGLLSTGMDWRAAVLQVVLLALYVVIYIPFMKASEAAQRKQFEMAE